MSHRPPSPCCGQNIKTGSAEQTPGRWLSPGRFCPAPGTSGSTWRHPAGMPLASGGQKLEALPGPRYAVAQPERACAGHVARRTPEGSRRSGCPGGHVRAAAPHGHATLAPLRQRMSAVPTRAHEPPPGPEAVRNQARLADVLNREDPCPVTCEEERPSGRQRGGLGPAPPTLLHNAPLNRRSEHRPLGTPAPQPSLPPPWRGFGVPPPRGTCICDRHSSEVSGLPAFCAILWNSVLACVPKARVPSFPVKLPHRALGITPENF